MLLETLVLGMLQVTAYRSVPQQTDDSPFYTSIGHKTHPYGIAVSQDLLKSGKVKYGDYLCVDTQGCYVVNDTMNPRHINSVDIWVANYAAEKAIPPQRRQVVRVRGKNVH
jgi:3D (Asp-Asp-Asp) domain-containing protein